MSSHSSTASTAPRRWTTSSTGFLAAHVDWPAHIDTLTELWMWQVIGAAHFDRWLTLFNETVHHQFDVSVAELAYHRGRQRWSWRSTSSSET
jgi:hypothetical protein